MDEVYTVKGGCPVCRGDVTGNDSSLYFCAKCNLLFSRPSLIE